MSGQLTQLAPLHRFPFEVYGSWVMRVIEVAPETYKGLSGVRLEWSPIVVLFGPNDGGKTNILESVAGGLRTIAGLGFDAPRTDRFHAEDEIIQLVLELDGVGIPGHVDDLFFRQWLQFGAVWLDADIEFADPSGHPQEGELPAPTEFYAEVAFELGDDLCTTDELLARFRDRALAAASAEWGESWTAVSEDHASLLDLCLSSRKFGWSENGLGEMDFLWLTPALPHPPDDLISAAQRLVANAGSLPAGVPEFRASGPELPERGFATAGSGFAEFVEQVARGKPSEMPFFWAEAWPVHLNLWDVVQIADTSESFTDLSARVTAFVRRHVPTPAADDHDESDPWLERGRAGWVRVAPQVVEICERLGRVATSLAPAFVTDRYDIIIEPVSPTDWESLGGRRLDVLLAHGRGEDERFELSSAGSGLAVWAAYALVEAMRRLDEEKPPAPRPDYKELMREYLAWAREDSSDWRISHPWKGRERRYQWMSAHWPLISRDQRQTIYLFDEPERHLHPLAQEQVAEWIVEQARRGSSNAVVATHALPFLALPSEEVKYFFVKRDERALTRISPLTEDVLGLLRQYGPEAGFAPAQIVQLTRAWLVVEGAHDQAVLAHFYGRELKRARVTILPLRGIKEARALLQLGHLASYQVPLVVLFDNVRSEWIRGGEMPPGLPSQEEKVIDQLQRLWSDPTVDLRVEPFPYPDIICALPGASVATTLKERYRDRADRFPGWETIIRSYRETGSQGRFKQFAFSLMGLKTDSDGFVDEVLARSPKEPLYGSPLHRAVEHMLAELASSQPQPRATAES